MEYFLLGVFVIGKLLDLDYCLILQDPWVKEYWAVEEVVVGVCWSKWKLVLKSHHALKKPCIHGKREFIMQLKASCPHFKTWALLLFPIPRFA